MSFRSPSRFSLCVAAAVVVISLVPAVVVLWKAFGFIQSVHGGAAGIQPNSSLLRIPWAAMAGRMLALTVVFSAAWWALAWSASHAAAMGRVERWIILGHWVVIGALIQAGSTRLFAWSAVQLLHNTMPFPQARLWAAAGVQMTSILLLWGLILHALPVEAAQESKSATRFWTLATWLWPIALAGILVLDLHPAAWRAAGADPSAAPSRCSGPLGYWLLSTPLPPPDAARANAGAGAGAVAGTAAGAVKPAKILTDSAAIQEASAVWPSALPRSSAALLIATAIAAAALLVSAWLRKMLLRQAKTTMPQEASPSVLPDAAPPTQLAAPPVDSHKMRSGRRSRAFIMQFVVLNLSVFLAAIVPVWVFVNYWMGMATGDVEVDGLESLMQGTRAQIGGHGGLGAAIFQAVVFFATAFGIALIARAFTDREGVDPAAPRPAKDFALQPLAILLAALAFSHLGWSAAASYCSFSPATGLSASMNAAGTSVNPALQFLAFIFPSPLVLLPLCILALDPDRKRAIWLLPFIALISALHRLEVPVFTLIAGDAAPALLFGPLQGARIALMHTWTGMAAAGFLLDFLCAIALVPLWFFMLIFWARIRAKAE